MAISFSGLKKGRPVTDQGTTEEKKFVVDYDFDKSSGEYIAPTSGGSDTIYFTRSIINNFFAITDFSITASTSFGTSGGSTTVYIEGEEGARFNLDFGGGASGDESIQTITGVGFLEITMNVGSNSSTSGRSPSVTLRPYIQETPETTVNDGISTTLTVSQSGVPATFATFSVAATYSVNGGTPISVGEGTHSVNWVDGDVLTWTYTAELLTTGNVNAFALMSGFLIVPSVHGGDPNNYTWSLGGALLSSGSESGVNRPTYQYHLREGSDSNIGNTFTWSGRIDTTDLGIKDTSTGSSVSWDGSSFPIYMRANGTSSGYEIRFNFIKAD